MKEDFSFEWIKTLTDKDYRNTFKHPDIIKCKECIYKCPNGYCSNIYSYPIMPKDFGCKNGIKKREKETISKPTLIQKIKCLLGDHKEVWIGKSNPFVSEILMRCSCCGKYGLWKTGSNVEVWFNKEDISKYLNESCQEMIKKYNL